MEKNSYEIFIDDEKRIIHYHHKGLLQTEEIRDAWDHILLMEEFTLQGYNMLSDYTEADFSFSIDVSSRIWDFLISIKEVMNGKMIAIITNKPVTTAFGYQFETESFKKLNFQLKVFTTKKVAVEWLSR